MMPQQYRNEQSNLSWNVDACKDWFFSNSDTHLQEKNAQLSPFKLFRFVVLQRKWRIPFKLIKRIYVQAE